MTSSTSTQIVCDVGNGPVGTKNVKVNVVGVGDATGSVTFTYTAGVSSIAPDSGSLGGMILVFVS